jgi:hypothetical protein
VFPIWLMAVALVIALVAISALCRLLLERAKRMRDKQHILRRVADLEEQRRAP